MLSEYKGMNEQRTNNQTNTKISTKTKCKNKRTKKFLPAQSEHIMDTAHSCWALIAGYDGDTCTCTTRQHLLFDVFISCDGSLCGSYLFSKDDKLGFLLLGQGCHDLGDLQRAQGLVILASNLDVDASVCSHGQCRADGFLQIGHKRDRFCFRVATQA